MRSTFSSRERKNLAFESRLLLGCVVDALGLGMLKSSVKMDDPLLGSTGIGPMAEAKIHETRLALC